MRPASTSAPTLSSEPGYQVIRRNGAVTPFDPTKIAVAVTKAFLAVEGAGAAGSRRVHDVVAGLTEQVVVSLTRRVDAGRTFHIEDVQDQVELALMRGEHHKVARAYVLYREARAKERARTSPTATPATAPSMRMRSAEGVLVPLDSARLAAVVGEACANLDGVSAQDVLNETHRNLFDGIREDELAFAPILAARTLIETEPNYARVSARLLNDKLRREALTFIAGRPEQATQAEMAARYGAYFRDYVRTGIENELLDPELGRFDLDRLAAALKPERDLQFDYLGLQTLYDRYFLHVHGTRFELPQAFFMRVACGLAVREIEREAKAIEFYDLLSSFDFMASTPTLFNAGTLRPQLSSCFLTSVPDDLDGIFKSIKDNALLSKYAGGLGNDWTRVRGLGAHIKGTNGESQGVVPFLKVANDTAIAVNQGGKRKGAVCAYLETWHIDIEEFLDLRKNTGDDRRRTHDMNTANWIPDLFMRRVEEDGVWTLFSPDEAPDLHDLTGKAFADRYAHYEAKAARTEMRVSKQLRAADLWRRMLTMLFETGHPWITFKDPCNLRSPQQHCGVVHSSNLCTEITLNTSNSEVAVCNLGSVNLVNHIVDGALDHAHLAHTVKTAMRMLDNVVDVNFYTIPEARASNLKHRPVGLGIMGFQDALSILRLPYTSNEAVAFADESMEAVSYWAISTSVDLAAERGRYSSFAGSLWSKGVLPLEFDPHPRRRSRRSGRRRSFVPSRLGWASGARYDDRHAQFQHDGDRPDCDNLQHMRRLTIDRTCLSKPLCEGEHVRRFHRRERPSCARPQGARTVGRDDDLGPQIFRRRGRRDRPCARRSESAVRDGLRNRQRLADRSGGAAAEMDRPGAVAQPLHRQPERSEAGRALPARLEARAQDDLLPAFALGDPRGEIDPQRHGWKAQRRLGHGACHGLADSHFAAGARCRVRERVRHR